MNGIKHRSLSFVTALMLVLTLFSLMPQGALKVHALSGSGTAADPYIVTTMSDLTFAFNVSEAGREGTRYVKLGADIIRESKNTYPECYRDNMVLNSSYPQHIYFDLAGHKLDIFTADYDHPLFKLSNNIDMQISDSVGTGSITHDQFSNTSDNYSAMFMLTDGAKLTVNGGTFETNSSDSTANCFSVTNGSLVINGGTFSSSIIVISNGNKGNTVINKGNFIATVGPERYLGVENMAGAISNSGTIKINKCEISSTTGVNVGMKFYNHSVTKLIDAFPENCVVLVDGNVKTIGEEEVNIKGKNIKIAHKISDVNITVPDVKAGEKLPLISSITSGLKGQMEWRYHGTETPVYSETPADAGSTYDLVVYLYTNDDFSVFADPTVTVNGKSDGCTVFTGSANSIIVTYTVTVPLIKVTDVDVYINKPVAGETIGSRSESYGYSSNVLVRTRDSARYRNLFYWHDGTKYLSDNAVFEGGKYYYAYVKFKAAAGYELSDNMNVKIEGVSAAKVSITTDEYGQKWALYSAKFYCHGDSPSRLVGDLNGNGTITADDAIIAARFAAGYSDYKTRFDPDIADMNRDGNVTADDAIIIARYAAGYGNYKEKYTNYI